MMNHHHFFKEFFVVSQDQHQPMTFHQLLVILIIFAHLNLFHFERLIFIFFFQLILKTKANGFTRRPAS